MSMSIHTVSSSPLPEVSTDNTLYLIFGISVLSLAFIIRSFEINVFPDFLNSPYISDCRTASDIPPTKDLNIGSSRFSGFS